MRQKLTRLQEQRIPTASPLSGLSANELWLCVFRKDKILKIIAERNSDCLIVVDGVVSVRLDFVLYQRTVRKIHEMRSI